MSGSDVIDLIEGSVRNSGTAAERLPAHMTAETYYDHLLHKGYLQEDGQSWSVICPILSLRRWIIDSMSSSV